jgi:hypothetical protein
VENLVRAAETSIESSTVTLCDVAAIAVRWHRPNIIKRIAATIGTAPVVQKNTNESREVRCRQNACIYY